MSFALSFFASVATIIIISAAFVGFFYAFGTYFRHNPVVRETCTVVTEPKKSYIHIIDQNKTLLRGTKSKHCSYNIQVIHRTERGRGPTATTYLVRLDWSGCEEPVVITVNTSIAADAVYHDKINSLRKRGYSEKLPELVSINF